MPFATAAANKSAYYQNMDNIFEKNNRYIDSKTRAVYIEFFKKILCHIQ